MDFPLKLSFKIFTFVPQFTVTDANDKILCYVRQKLFKLKEKISVFSDTERQNQIFTINADRIIDFSARYHFTDMQQRSLGSVKRKGMKSLWRASYEIYDGEMHVANIREKSVFIRFLDSYLGICSGLLFHPTYIVTRNDGTEIMSMRKMPSLFEGKFLIEKFGEFQNDQEETRILLSLLLLGLLERVRG